MHETWEIRENASRGCKVCLTMFDPRNSRFGSLSSRKKKKKKGNVSNFISTRTDRSNISTSKQWKSRVSFFTRKIHRSILFIICTLVKITLDDRGEGKRRKRGKTRGNWISDSRQKVILVINFTNNEINGRGNNLFLASNVVFWKWIWHTIGPQYRFLQILLQIGWRADIAFGRFRLTRRRPLSLHFDTFSSSLPSQFFFFIIFFFFFFFILFWIRSCERSKPLGIDLLFIRNKRKFL